MLEISSELAPSSTIFDHLIKNFCQLLDQS